MAVQAAVTLNSVVYSPAGLKGGVALWLSRVGGIVAGFSKLSQTYKDPTTGTQTKIDFQIDVPVLLRLTRLAPVKALSCGQIP